MTTFTFFVKVDLAKKIAISASKVRANLGSILKTNMLFKVNVFRITKSRSFNSNILF